MRREFSTLSPNTARLMNVPYYFSTLWDAPALSPDEVIGALKRVHAFSLRGSAVNRLFSHNNFGRTRREQLFHARVDVAERAGAEQDGGGPSTEQTAVFSAAAKDEYNLSKLPPKPENAAFRSGSSPLTGEKERWPFKRSNPYEACWLEPSLQLLGLLSRRFYESCESYFPPQVVEVAVLFAEIGYCDEFFRRGFLGRLEDLLARPSERRLLHILSACSRLRMRPSDWWPPVAHQLFGNLQNLKHGLPNALEALGFVLLEQGAVDHEQQPSSFDAETVIDALATQLLLQKQNLGGRLFAKGFEALSLHRYDYPEMWEEAVRLLEDGPPEAARGRADGEDEDAILTTNLVAGLQRYRCSESKNACLGARLDLEFAGRRGVVCSEAQVAELVNGVEDRMSGEDRTR